MPKKKIAMFDSGVGGLNILIESQLLLPHVDFYYFIDSEFCPYGNKSKESIIERSKQIVKDFESINPDLIVLACNTATAVAINELRSSFDHLFVGVEPYINLLNKKDLSQKSKIGVLVTELTGRSERFLDLKEKYDPENIIDVLMSKNLASMIEEGYWKKEYDFDKIKAELKSFNLDEYDHIILGCTHYEFVSSFIEKKFHLKTHHPSPSIAGHIANLIKEESKENGKIYFKNKLENKFKEWSLR